MRQSQKYKKKVKQKTGETNEDSNRSTHEYEAHLNILVTTIKENFK